MAKTLNVQVAELMTANKGMTEEQAWTLVVNQDNTNKMRALQGLEPIYTLPNTPVVAISGQTPMDVQQANLTANPSAAAAAEDPYAPGGAFTNFVDKAGKVVNGAMNAWKAQYPEPAKLEAKKIEPATEPTQQMPTRTMEQQFPKPTIDPVTGEPNITLTKKMLDTLLADTVKYTSQMINPNSNIGDNPQTPFKTNTPAEAAKLNPLDVMKQNTVAQPLSNDVIAQLRGQ